MKKLYAVIAIFIMYLLPQLAMGSEQQDVAPEISNPEQTATQADEPAESTMKKPHVSGAEDASLAEEEEDEDEEPDCA